MKNLGNCGTVSITKKLKQRDLTHIAAETLVLNFGFWFYCNEPAAATGEIILDPEPKTLYA